MGIYGREKDYQELVKDNIEKAKLLYGLNNEDRKLVETLLEEREKIRNENGLFANIRINIINSKIEKITNKK